MNRRFFNAVVVISTMLFAGCSSGLDLSKSDTQLNVGVKAARNNLWREALFRFNRAVTIDPDNALALNNLAVAYEGTGEFEKARQAYTEALRLDKSNQYIQKNYSRFVEFYSRNKKRELQTAAGVAAVAGVPAANPAKVPDAGEPVTAPQGSKPQPPTIPSPLPPKPQGEK